MWLSAMHVVRDQGLSFVLGESYMVPNYYYFQYVTYALALTSCFKSNPHLRVPMMNGSKCELISVEEWLQVDSFYDHLKQTAELQGDVNLASQAIHSICALRASAVGRMWESNKLFKSTITTTIKSFPIGLSTRNLCLVGTFQQT